jgi:hypothetical protein
MQMASTIEGKVLSNCMLQFFKAHKVGGHVIFYSFFLFLKSNVHCVLFLHFSSCFHIQIIFLFSFDFLRLFSQCLLLTILKVNFKVKHTLGGGGKGGNMGSFMTRVYTYKICCI